MILDAEALFYESMTADDLDALFAGSEPVELVRGPHAGVYEEVEPGLYRRLDGRWWVSDMFGPFLWAPAVSHAS